MSDSTLTADSILMEACLLGGEEWGESLERLENSEKGIVVHLLVDALSLERLAHVSPDVGRQGIPRLWDLLVELVYLPSDCSTLMERFLKKSTLSPNEDLSRPLLKVAEEVLSSWYVSTEVVREQRIAAGVYGLLSTLVDDSRWNPLRNDILQMLRRLLRTSRGFVRYGVLEAMSEIQDVGARPAMREILDEALASYLQNDAEEPRARTLRDRIGS
jgi:hypothetical protein